MLSIIYERIRRGSSPLLGTKHACSNRCKNRRLTLNFKGFASAGFFPATPTPPRPHRENVTSTSRERHLAAGLCAVAIVLAGGCAGTPNPVAQYGKVDAEAAKFDEQTIFIRECKARGGSVQIERRGTFPAHCRNGRCPPGPADKLSCLK